MSIPTFSVFSVGITPGSDHAPPVITVLFGEETQIRLTAADALRLAAMLRAAAAEDPFMAMRMSHHAPRRGWEDK